MIIKVLWIIMWCIIIFASGFLIGFNILSTKIYDAMYDALHSISVKEDGADYVRGAIYVCDKVDAAMKNEKENEECQ